MSRVRGDARAWLLACLGAAACGGDSSPMSTVDIDADGGAAQQTDATANGRADAGGDAGGPDAAIDAGDGAVLVGQDGAVIPNAACTVEQGGITTVSSLGSVSPDDPVAVSVRNDGASLTWVAYESGKRHVKQGWFSASSSDLITVEPFETSATSNQIEPALAATANGYLTVWSDDLVTANDFNLRARSIAGAGDDSSSQTQLLTSDTGADHNPAVAVGADGNAVVVFQTQAPGVLGRSILLSSDGKVMGPVNQLADYGASVGRPALAKLGTGYLLAWVDNTVRRVHLQRLDAKGAANGASTVFDAEGSAEGTLDLATADTGGAAVWDVYVAGARAEIRFRTFDIDAMPTGTERVLTDSPDTGLVPAMAPLRGGYALAYRSIVKNDYQLELALVDRFGNVIAKEDIAPLVDSQVPVALRVSPDGQQLFLSWIDRIGDTTAYQLQRTWIHCD